MDRQARRSRHLDRLGEIRRHRPDYGLVLVMGLLLIIGLIVIYAISPGLSHVRGGVVGEDYYFTRQLISIGLGTLLFIFMAFFPLERWRTLAYAVGVAALISSALLLIPGAGFNDPVNGATRWIQLGPFSFQPAELMKFAILLNGAVFLSERVAKGELQDTRRTLRPYLLALGIIGLIVVVFQKDLGSMMVIVAIMLAMLYVAGIKMVQMAMIFGAIIAGIVGAIIIAPHRMERFLTFLNPEADALGSGYHISQALIAIGSGGTLGQGLGRSVQAFGYLPEAANDSIFAIFAEKFGFLGSLSLLVLLGILLVKIISIIERTPDLFARLLATGIFAWLCAHVLINIGAMVGLMPLKGITLPFISYGGSSVLFIMAIMGMVLQISRYTVPKARMNSVIHKGKQHEDLGLRRRNGRTRLASASRNYSAR